MTSSKPGRFLSLIASAVCLAALVAGPGVASRAATPQRVTVTMTEFHFRLSVNHVRVGTVVFAVVNKGQLTHTFDVQRLSQVTPIVLPGRRTVLRVTFKKPGKYYYLCTVGAHVQYGMWGYLRVTA